jgi:hypothetical protein
MHDHFYAGLVAAASIVSIISGIVIIAAVRLPKR